MTKSKPVVFFGSGPIAAATLKSLIRAFEISAVVTKPQPEHGHRTTPPVLQLAQEYDIPVYTPTNKAELSALAASGSLSKDIGIVVDYGLFIPKNMIDYFDKGIVNSHFSLLPLWRGADPITFPLLAGDSETGVSLMLIVEAMDEGDLIAQERIKIADNENAFSLTDKLVSLSNQMLIETTSAYLEGKIKSWPQDTSQGATYSRKLSKEDGLINWGKPAQEIEREIRAFSIWPKSYGTLGTIDVVVTAAHVIEAAGQPARVFRHGKDLAVYCGENALVVDKLKVPGKPEMTGQAFLNGYGQNIN